MSALINRLTAQVEYNIQVLGCKKVQYGKIGRSTKKIDKELIAFLNAYSLLQIGVNEEQTALIDCYLRLHYG